MDKKDIETAKKMKNKMWLSSLKEFYEPEDVLRYYEEASEIKRLNPKQKILAAEDLFTDATIKAGNKLYKAKLISRAKTRLNFLLRIEIPELRQEIKRLKSKVL